MLLSPLGERLGEGVMQKAIFGLTPSPNLSPKGERNMKVKNEKIRRPGLPLQAAFHTVRGHPNTPRARTQPECG